MGVEKTFEYKGYKGDCQYSEADNVFYGKILSIPDLVTYEADLEADLEMEFRLAVDSFTADIELLNRRTN